MSAFGVGLPPLRLEGGAADRIVAALEQRAGTSAPQCRRA